MSIPFEIPAHFVTAEKLGQVVRFGAILKDTETGRIVAHMQETGFLNQLANLPANAFLSPVSTLSSVASNYQLYRVDQKITAMQQMLSGLQSMQIANLALAGLGIGISVAGFAVIKSRIDKVSTKIDNLESLISREFEDQRLRELKNLEADLDGQLDHAEEGWTSTDGLRIWTRVADRLNDMVYYYPKLIEEHLAAQTPDLKLAGYLLERYRVLAATRVECLVLIGELESARDFSRRFMARNARLLDPVSPLDLARRRAATAEGDALTREAAFRREIEPARQFTAAIREFQDLSETRPLLIETLIEKRLNGRDYIEQLRAEKETPLLLLPAA
ncbi:hypothetical protein [Antarcticimicrobium sediminis]|uniref:Uncharacterized protein n=1 Tax=Antarcticimicrobium sediminis TaxID=2546227 RepID=A0A4V2Z8C6_9RHOB|nr:hypothetical protein [Antarcticimicrobium sediminis]TDE39836.1 hypothetical protein E1B25_07255 [Antarcticimicrobium sediminis]